MGCRGVTVSGFKEVVSGALREYVATCDVVEVLTRLDGVAVEGDADGGVARREVAKATLFLALRSGDRDREALCSLLSSLHVRGFLSHADIEAMTSMYLLRLTDVRLDAPRAPDNMANIIAFLVQDDVISDDFVLTIGQGLRPASEGGGDDAAEVAALATALAVVREKALMVLQSPIPTAMAQLRAMYRDIVRRYFATRNFDELQEEVVSLNARHTVHELVRKVMQVALDGDAFRRELASSLLAQGVGSGLVPRTMVAEGILRTLRSAHELALDHPSAPLLIAELVARAVEDDLLPRDFMSTIPPFLDAATPRSAPTSPDGTGSGATAIDVPPMPTTPILAKANSSLGSPTAVSPPTNVLGHGSAVRKTDGSWVARSTDVGGKGSGVADFGKATATVQQLRHLLAQPAAERRAVTLHGFPMPLTEAHAVADRVAQDALTAGEEHGSDACIVAITTGLASLPVEYRSEVIPILTAAALPRRVELLASVLPALWHGRVVAGRHATAALWRSFAHAWFQGEESSARLRSVLTLQGVLARTGCIPTDLWDDRPWWLEDDDVDAGGRGSASTSSFKGGFSGGSSGGGAFNPSAGMGTAVAATATPAGVAGEPALDTLSACKAAFLAALTGGGSV